MGKTKVSRKIDIAKDMPSQKELGKVVSVAAGYDHVMALNDEGEIIQLGK